jgi:polysaccharide pyruvyl transferase WcaK-like protein
MNIIVENGAGDNDNIGDLSMQEGVIRLLSRVFPKQKFTFIYSGNLICNISDIDNVNFDDPFTLKFIYYLDKIKKRNSLVFFGKICIYSIYLLRIIFGFNLLKTKIIYKSKVLSLKEYSDRYDALLLCGGGYLNDIFKHELISKIYLMKVFYKQKKSFLLTGQQLGPFNNLLLKMLLKKILRKAEFIGLRENLGSKRIVENDNELIKITKLTGDDSFGIIPEKNIYNLNKLIPFKCQEFIAINYRYSGYAIANHDSFIKFGQILCDLQKILKFPYLLVPITLNPGDSDLLTGELLQKQFPLLKYKILNDSNMFNSQNIKLILKNAFAGIGVSYHFCTFALSVGTLAVCVYDGKYYEQKAKGISSFWEDERLAVSINKDSVHRISNQLQNTLFDKKLRNNIKALAEKKIGYWEETIVEAFNDFIK